MPSHSSNVGFRSRQTGMCSRWPRLPLAKGAYRAAAEYTATRLASVGQWKSSGRGKTMVVAKARSSKRFWNADSAVEKFPLWSASTS